jgi:hypothetical protein
MQDGVILRADVYRLAGSTNGLTRFCKDPKQGDPGSLQQAKGLVPKTRERVVALEQTARLPSTQALSLSVIPALTTWYFTLLLFDRSQQPCRFLDIRWLHPQDRAVPSFPSRYRIAGSDVDLSIGQLCHDLCH